MAQSYKSTIAFGVVYIPITLHACVKSKNISFNTLYKKTGERIRYKKTCENCPPDVSAEEIVKGYQYEKDKYVIITNEELNGLKNKRDKSIEILEFVDLKQIDPIYFNKSYYVKPSGAENAYNLIFKAIETENKVGIAKTVLGTKEQLVALRVINGQMVLYTLYFYDEIQVNPIKNQDVKVDEKELKLAKTIIDNMTAEFNPEKYKNEYREKIMSAIQDKLNGKKLKSEEAVVQPHNVINIMDALKRSVEKTKSAKSSNRQKSAKVKKNSAS
ncbi:MAG: Ku protein [Clostridia bacterium]|jgi:DNA end-binding protein Ku|nr:Ku protein [Clostridia bacterium]MDD3232398.1 Ku protein [Clostridia bacterium]MDD3862883.1 Ku protein [Clostridia bacterium]MDD4408686.1 Ku protein [Clostridia bacterium]